MVERVDPQTGEDFDAVIQFSVDAIEEATRFLWVAHERGGISRAPMCSHRLTRPKWAILGRGSVADRENEIERRTIRLCELVPAFAAQTRAVEVQPRQKLDRHRMDGSLRMTSGAESPESALSPPAD